MKAWNAYGAIKDRGTKKGKRFFFLLNEIKCGKRSESLQASFTQKDLIK